MRILSREAYPGQWTAIDDATYDGPGSPIGCGSSEAEAVAELMVAIEDRAERMRDAVSRDERDRGAFVRVCLNRPW